MASFPGSDHSRRESLPAFNLFSTTSFPNGTPLDPHQSPWSSNGDAEVRLPQPRRRCFSKDVEDRQLKRPATPLYLPPSFSEGEEWSRSEEWIYFQGTPLRTSAVPSPRTLASISSSTTLLTPRTSTLPQPSTNDHKFHQPQTVKSSSLTPPPSPSTSFSIPQSSTSTPTFTPPTLPTTSYPAIPLPSPFRHASESPCSVVVRPSVGSFLYDYQLYDDLHIGIADSKGVVIDFDKGGIRVRENYWNQCLVIREDQLRTCKMSSSSSADAWDETLKRCVDVARWTLDGRDAYDGEINNCLDFVLRFIQLLNSSCSSSSRDCDRVAFTRQKLLPLMESSMVYIRLYRKLVQSMLTLNDD